MNEIVLYLWTKFRAIPFFIVLRGILQSDFLFVMRHLIDLTFFLLRYWMCFTCLATSPDRFVCEESTGQTLTICSHIFLDRAQIV